MYHLIMLKTDKIYHKMTTAEKYKKYILGNYGERSITLSKGKGCEVIDDDGKKYLDFGGGIAVLSLGHANGAWLKALERQAAKLAHCSNLYMHSPQADLAEELVGLIGQGKMFFCNSGTEANEALIKLSRLHGLKAAGEPNKKYRILGAKNAFHGRTLGALAATPQEKIQKGFSPLLDGFEFGEYNDISSFEKLFDDSVAAVILEPVQGESGVTPAEAKFLKGIKALCKKHNALLMFDEVQCGIGRSGAFLACQKYGVMPDALSMAKGLGGGFPIGAMWVSKKYADLFWPGSHGTTFGGNPLACAVALAVLKEIKSKNLAANAGKMGDLLRSGLEKIVKAYPQKLKLVRGLGLMLAVLFQDSYKNTDAAKKAAENGLLLIPAGANALRFLPALNVKADDVKRALKLFEKTVKEL